MATQEEVLEYWFGDSLSSPEAAAARQPFWFGGGEEADHEIFQPETIKYQVT